MRDYESLIFVGPSGSGKTTLVNGLRLPDYAGRVVIPRRYITRPPRIGDDLRENVHVDRETFMENRRDGLIKPYWTRTFDDGRQEEYGFEAIGPKDGRLRAYAANTAILLDNNHSVQSVLEGGMVIGAMAPRDLRLERLIERSPDMSEAERNLRLEEGDIADLLGHSGLSHILIDTDRPLASCQAVVDAIVSSIFYTRAHDQK